MHNRGPIFFFFVSLRLEGRCIEQEEKCPSKKERDGHSWGTGDGGESIHALVLLANGRTEHWVGKGEIGIKRLPLSPFLFLPYFSLLL